MKVLLLIITMLFSSSLFSTEKQLSEADLRKFVQEAVDYVKKVGFKKACKEFTYGKSFKRGELYIFAYDYDGNATCHGAKASLVGKPLINFKDKKGKPVIKELIASIKDPKKKGQVVEYYWPHPAKKSGIYRKLGFALGATDKYWVGSGIYSEK